jgi:hypothetical protein
MMEAVRRCTGFTPKLMYAAITEPGMCIVVNGYTSKTIII